MPPKLPLHCIATAHSVIRRDKNMLDPLHLQNFFSRGIDGSRESACEGSTNITQRLNNNMGGVKFHEKT